MQAPSSYRSALTDLAIRREKIGFWMHLSVYVFVNALLVAENLIYSPSTVWFVFVLFPWGIGVVAHYIGAYHLTPLKMREKELRATADAPGNLAPPPG